MTRYMIIADGELGAEFDDLENAKAWVDAGNYEHANREILIVKVIATKKRNMPVFPEEKFTDWRR